MCIILTEHWGKRKSTLRLPTIYNGFVLGIPQSNSSPMLVDPGLGGGGEDGVLPYKSDGGARRSFYGFKFVYWYRLGR